MELTMHVTSPTKGDVSNFVVGDCVRQGETLLEAQRRLFTGAEDRAEKRANVNSEAKPAEKPDSKEDAKVHLGLSDPSEAHLGGNAFEALSNIALRGYQGPGPW